MVNRDATHGFGGYGNANSLYAGDEVLAVANRMWLCKPRACEGGSDNLGGADSSGGDGADSRMSIWMTTHR